MDGRMNTPPTTISPHTGQGQRVDPLPRPGVEDPSRKGFHPRPRPSSPAPLGYRGPGGVSADNDLPTTVRPGPFRGAPGRGPQENSRGQNAYSSISNS